MAVGNAKDILLLWLQPVRTNLLNWDVLLYIIYPACTPFSRSCDRVVPAHSLKFISQLQHNLGEKLSNSTPFMVRVDTNSGHRGGISTTKEVKFKQTHFTHFNTLIKLKILLQIEKNADLISFIINSLKIQKLNRSGLIF